VHATGQVISFKTDAAFPFECLAVATNSELPADIAVREASLVEDRFSARFSAIERTYLYAVISRPARPPLLARYADYVWSELDIQAASEAAVRLIGTHDFRSFCGMLPESGSTERTIRALTVTRSADLIRIEIRADGFLHHMVRTIVGTLLECAMGRRTPDSVARILTAKDRSAAGPTAPPRGLYLAGVRYRDGFDSFAEPPVFARVFAPV